jgi:hypothetical protein
MEKLFTFIQENPDTVSALAAMISVFVAFVAILLTVISLSMQRRHNIMSVTPIAYINPINYENSIAVEIRNSGTGPLRITRFEAKDKNGHSAEDLIGLMPKLPNGICWETFFSNLKDFSIIPSQSLTLLKLSGKVEDPNYCEIRDTIRKRLSEIEITLTYRDIYGRKMPKEHKDMKWFARHFIAGFPHSRE